MSHTILEYCGKVECRKAIEQLLYEKRTLRDALQELLDACPTGFGDDRRLNEAQKVAEALLKEML